MDNYCQKFSFCVYLIKFYKVLRGAVFALLSKAEDFWLILSR